MYERSQRLGGRILSLRNQGPRGDLTADMGAYRFVDTPTKESHSTWSYIYTPLTAALIETKLGLHIAPYEPGNPTSHMKKSTRNLRGLNAFQLRVTLPFPVHLSTL